MAWNKCTEKLPEVGMLIVTRRDHSFYNVGIVRFSYDSFFSIIDGDRKCTYTFFDGLEWKEIEKD